MISPNPTADSATDPTATHDAAALTALHIAAPDAPASCLTRGGMAAECKWAELGIGPTISFECQMRLLAGIVDDPGFDTLYIRIGEPGQPGYCIDSQPTDASLAGVLVAARGCNIATVTWAGSWDIDQSVYGKNRRRAGRAPLGFVPVVIQRRRIADSVHERMWVTDIAFPRCTRDYLKHAVGNVDEYDRIEGELRDAIKRVQLNLM